MGVFFSFEPSFGLFGPSAGETAAVCCAMICFVYDVMCTNLE